MRRATVSPSTSNRRSANAICSPNTRTWQARMLNQVEKDFYPHREAPGAQINSLPMREGSFVYDGRRIAYAEFGEGERTLVLAHGLLMNRHMYDHVAPAMAERGIRVI